MKKLISLLVLGLTFNILDAQEMFTPMKSPDVKGFLNSNYLPVNESTGRVNITIPIYEINLDGLSIPISLSYDTSGVKVNSSASRVGLNWSLNAAGFVSKEIKDKSDISVFLVQSDSNGPGDVYLNYGYLRHLLHWDRNVVNLPVVSQPSNALISEPYKDTQPDLFHVMAPELFTKFTHKSNGTPFEIDKSETKIKSPFKNKPNNLFYRHQLKPGFSFELTPKTGFKYIFDEVEFTAFTPITNEKYAIHGSSNLYYYKDLPNGLVDPILPLDVSEETIEKGELIFRIPIGL